MAYMTKYAGVDEWAMEKSKPVTPKADRWYEGRIAPVLVPSKGLCKYGKCVLKEGHTSAHWPQ